MRRLLGTIAIAAIVTFGTVAAAPAAAPVPLPVLVGPVRIMIAGHSIAAGYPVQCADGSNVGDRWAFGSWLVEVAKLPVTLVGSQVSGSCHAPYDHHEGYSDKTVGWLADNIGALLTANPAEILIIRTGVNDAKAPLYRTAAQIAGDYTRVIDNARATIPGIRILASQEIPPNGSMSVEFARASVTIRQFNALLPALVAPYGDAVHIGRNALVTSAMLADGLHPNSNGYFTIAWIAVRQPDGIWPWLSSSPPPATDAGPIQLDPFGG